MAMRRVDAQQLPLDLGHRAGQSRDDLIVTAANAEAVAYIERWPRWPAPVTILAGPAGAGKSHLAEIWRGHADALTARSRAQPQNQRSRLRHYNMSQAPMR